MTFFKNFKYNYFIIIRVYYRNDKFKEVLRMKRIKAACICQTLHFQLKEDVAHDYAVQLVHEVNITVQMYPCSEGTNTGSLAL